MAPRPAISGGGGQAPGEKGFLILSMAKLVCINLFMRILKKQYKCE
jgi:hypothetical protein